MKIRYTTKSKIQSRQDSIINPAIKLFHGQLPDNLQYWTMCSYCNHKDSELNQLLNSNLIAENQFHGVDIDQDVYNRNIEMNTSANFYRNDIYQAMVNAKVSNSFKPGIINLDTLSMGEKASELVSKILTLVTFKNLDNKAIERKFPLIFVNTVLKAPRGNLKETVNDFPEFLFKEKDFKLCQKYTNDSWNIYSIYNYKNGNTVMQTYFLTNKEQYE